MELDHRQDTLKVGAVSNLVGGGCTDEKLLNEIAKCDVVCANCHRMRTYLRREEKNFCKTVTSLMSDLAKTQKKLLDFISFNSNLFRYLPAGFGLWKHFGLHSFDEILIKENENRA